MSHQQFRRWLYAILIVSALMRFGFLLFGNVVPVMWDARKYAAGGLGVISYFDDSGDNPAHDERADRYRFRHYYDKYIQGEKIEWLAYTPHTLTEARDELFFSGPLYPAVLAAVFAFSPAADLDVARGLGVLLDLLSNLMLILIAVRLIGRPAALVAGAIYALYFPFMLASTMLLLETPTSFLLLLAIYMLLRGTETHQRKHYIMAGTVTGLLMLVKPTALLLGVPLSIAFYLYTRQKWSFGFFLSRLLLYATPALVIFIGWFAVTSARYGQLTLRDPNYSEANLRQSSSIVYEGYDLDKVEKDFWTYSIADQITGDPTGYIGLTAKKFERLWSRPFNDFRRFFVIPYQVNEIFHTLVVSLGLLGLLWLLFTNFGSAGWILFIAGYYTSIHVVFHSISRYSFNAMPLIVIAAGYCLLLLIERYRRSKPAARRAALLGLVLVLVGWIIDCRWAGLFSNGGLQQWQVISAFILKFALIALGLLLFGRRLLSGYELNVRLLVPLAATVVFAVTGWSSALARDGWAEFSCTLDDPAVKAGTRLYISNPTPVKESELLAAVIDLNSGRGRKNSFAVSIDGHEQEYVGGQRPLSDLFYPKPTYRFYSRYIPLGIEQFRQYAIIPLDAAAIRAQLDSAGYVDISVAINQRFKEENNFVHLWGNYPTGGGEVYIPGVRFTSIERFVHKDDPRIRYPKTFLSDSTISYYIDRNSNDIQSSHDLSKAQSKQAGRYNIFLIHFKPDGSFLVY